MKNTLGILAIFIMLVAGAMLFSGCGRKEANNKVDQSAAVEQNIEENGVESAVNKPWVQVLKDGVFLSVNSSKTALKTGDEINRGDVIETDKNGLANIYFPDGSMARLDSKTIIILNDGLYDAGNKTLIVRMKLVAGNVWSKIMALATPESIWEVKTTNAVAAVRGSAFGMSFYTGKTRIIGSEHQIIVRPIDPKTEEVIEGQEAVVEEEKYLVITSGSVLDYASGKRKISEDVLVADERLMGEDWIRSSVEADALINAKLQKLKETGLDNDAALERYRIEVINNFRPYLNVLDDSAAHRIVTSSDNSIDNSGLNLLDVGVSSQDNTAGSEPGAGSDQTEGGSEIIIEPDSGSNTSTPVINAR